MSQHEKMSTRCAVQSAATRSHADAATKEVTRKWLSVVSDLLSDASKEFTRLEQLEKSCVEVLKPGTECFVADCIPATIVGVKLNFLSSVMYLITWWDGRVKNEEWFYREEITISKDSQPISIGFISK